MGGGITMSYVNAGIPVVLKEVGDQALEEGIGANPTKLHDVRQTRAA